MRMQDPAPVDFKQVIADIEAAGITTHKLATMMHRQYTQVKRWRSGSEPKYYEGQMLLMIHAEYVSIKATIIQAEKQEIATA